MDTFEMLELYDVWENNPPIVIVDDSPHGTKVHIKTPYLNYSIFYEDKTTNFYEYAENLVDIYQLQYIMALDTASIDREARESADYFVNKMEKFYGVGEPFPSFVRNEIIEKLVDEIIYPIISQYIEDYINEHRTKFTAHLTYTRNEVEEEVEDED